MDTETVQIAADIVAEAHSLPEFGKWNGNVVEQAKWHTYIGYLENAGEADSAAWVANMTPADLAAAAKNEAESHWRDQLDSADTDEADRIEAGR